MRLNRYVLGALVAGFLLPVAAPALICTTGLDGYEDPHASVDWDTITPGLLNSVFREHFTILTTWVWSNPTDGRWGITKFQEFADSVMSASDPEAGYAQRVLDYFAEDQNF